MKTKRRFQRLTSVSNRRKKSHSQNRYRPRLEELETRRMPLKRSTLSVHDLVDSAHQVLATLIANAKITVERDIAARRIYEDILQGRRKGEKAVTIIDATTSIEKQSEIVMGKKKPKADTL